MVQATTKTRGIKRGTLIIVMQPGISFRLPKTTDVEFHCQDGAEPWFEPDQLPDGTPVILLTKRRVSA